MQFNTTYKEKIFEDDKEINVLYLLNEYADSKPSFKDSFLENVDKIYLKHGFITKSQYHSLVTIYKELETKNE